MEISCNITHVYPEIEHMEERFTVPEKFQSLQKLKIKTPEKHDLALLKVDRLEARDKFDEMLPFNAGNDL